MTAETDRPEASVIICTHNPRAEYLQRTLQALEAQTLPRARWEFLLIDNASKDPVANRFDLAWHPHGRHVQENTLGLTAARLRGITESRSDLIVFVDDDNLLDASYLDEALRIARDYPFLGAWGAGVLKPEFEMEPPEWITGHLMRIAVFEIRRDVWSNLQDTLSTVPCGAGLCVRRSVACEYQRLCREDVRRLEMDRKGVSLSSGGDTDFALVSCDLGLGTGMFTRLKLTHLIPRGRLTLEYFEKLIEAMTVSGELLRTIRGNPRPDPPKPTLLGRILQRYHRLRISRVDRAFADAYERGLKKAREVRARLDLSGERP